MRRFQAAVFGLWPLLLISLGQSLPSIPPPHVKVDSEEANPILNIQFPLPCHACSDGKDDELAVSLAIRPSAAGCSNDNVFVNGENLEQVWDDEARHGFGAGKIQSFLLNSFVESTVSARWESKCYSTGPHGDDVQLVSFVIEGEGQEPSGFIVSFKSGNAPEILRLHAGGDAIELPVDDAQSWINPSPEHRFGQDVALQTELLELHELKKQLHDLHHQVKAKTERVRKLIEQGDSTHSGRQLNDCDSLRCVWHNVLGKLPKVAHSVAEYLQRPFHDKEQHRPAGWLHGLHPDGIQRHHSHPPLPPPEGPMDDKPHVRPHFMPKAHELDDIMDDLPFSFEDDAVPPPPPSDQHRPDCPDGPEGPLSPPRVPAHPDRQDLPTPPEGPLPPHGEDHPHPHRESRPVVPLMDHFAFPSHDEHSPSEDDHPPPPPEGDHPQPPPHGLPPPPPEGHHPPPPPHGHPPPPPPHGHPPPPPPPHGHPPPPHHPPHGPPPPHPSGHVGPHPPQEHGPFDGKHHSNGMPPRPPHPHHQPGHILESFEHPRHFKTFLPFVVLALLCTLLFVHIRRRARDSRRRVDRAFQREERSARRALRHAARRQRWSKWWSRYRNPTSQADYDEKRALILNQEDMLEDAMQSELHDLLRAHQLVDGLVRARQDHGQLVGESTPAELEAGIAGPSTGMLDGGELPPPRYSEDLLRDEIQVVDGFLYTPSATDETPDSSVVDCSPRLSLDTSRTRASSNASKDGVNEK